jgi:hypothetical protein
MLVERFGERIFEQLLDLTAQSGDGRVNALAVFERYVRGAKEKGKGRAATQREFPEEWAEDKWLLAWAKLDPPLGDIDLRPYYFISREKTPGFASELGLGVELEVLAEKLAGGNTLVLTGLKGRLQALDPSSSRKLFDYLVERARRATTWKTKPSEFDGLCALCRERQHLQEELVRVLEEMPVAELGPWPAAGMKTVLTNGSAAARYAKLIQQWVVQTENKSLQTAAKSLSEL